MEHKGKKARRRTAVSPPKHLSINHDTESKQRTKNFLKSRLSKLLPEGLLRPFWWIYAVLIIFGICATRLSFSSSSSSATAIPPPAVVTNTTTSTTMTDPFEQHQNGPKTMALLYPPGLFGGYRNQVMRFVAFVVHAMENDYKQILLPSLIWTTTMDVSNKPDDWVPVPHDMLFDVDLWNSILGDGLPTLVRYKKSYHSDWKVPSDTKHDNPLVKAVLKKGFMKPISKISEAVAKRQVDINPRKIDLLQNVSHCQNPAVYGGGKSAGRLWWDYLDLQNKGGEFPFHADAKILKALQPKQEFRELAMQCVVDGSRGIVKKQKATTESLPYVALHARVELEMMGHKCGRSMEKNLTRIFEMVDGLVDDLSENIEGVFVAVSRSGIEVKEGQIYNKFQAYADENLKTMNRVVGSATSPGVGLRKGTVSVFECGRSAMQRYYDSNPEEPNFGSLLESMVNFHVATQATAFVGVRGSSYSTDIWTTRYYLGKGEANYEYTPDGIKRIENGGLPPTHKNC